MWEFRRFCSYAKAEQFIEKNKHRYECQHVFINNGYGVEYRELRLVGNGDY